MPNNLTHPSPPWLLWLFWLLLTAGLSLPLLLRGQILLGCLVLVSSLLGLALRIRGWQKLR